MNREHAALVQEFMRAYRTLKVATLAHLEARERLLTIARPLWSADLWGHTNVRFVGGEDAVDVRRFFRAGRASNRLGARLALENRTVRSAVAEEISVFHLRHDAPAILQHHPELARIVAAEAIIEEVRPVSTPTPAGMRRTVAVGRRRTVKGL